VWRAPKRPRVIAERLDLSDLQMRISLETIYQSSFVQPRGELRGQLTAEFADRSRRQPPTRARVPGSFSRLQDGKLSPRRAFPSRRAESGLELGFGACDGDLVRRRAARPTPRRPFAISSARRGAIDEPVHAAHPGMFIQDQDVEPDRERLLSVRARVPLEPQLAPVPIDRAAE
jgi:hypothetical protein